MPLCYAVPYSAMAQQETARLACFYRTLATTRWRRRWYSIDALYSSAMALTTPSLGFQMQEHAYLERGCNYLRRLTPAFAHLPCIYRCTLYPPPSLFSPCPHPLYFGLPSIILFFVVLLQGKVSLEARTLGSEGGVGYPTGRRRIDM